MTQPYQDFAKAISFLYNHADIFKIDKNHYSLWGGSAGARMAAILGNQKYFKSLVQSDIPVTDAVIMQYTGYNKVSQYDAPTYVCVGNNDMIADYRLIKQRLDSLNALGIPTEYHCYEGVSHGFGLGTETVAKGWIDDAIAFWDNQMKR